MKKLMIALLASTAIAGPASAALEPGAKAPDFTAQAALAGKPLNFSLSEALKKGPVVLYFFPAAFTSGCSIEAHQFAEATERFAALGATMIGVSTDDIATQLKFSAQDCQGKFAVASDANKSVVKAYDAAMMLAPMYANRISYVISPSHSIVYAYQSADPSQHVANTLAAVADWQKRQPKK